MMGDSSPKGNQGISQKTEFILACRQKQKRRKKKAINNSLHVCSLICYVVKLSRSYDIIEKQSQSTEDLSSKGMQPLSHSPYLDILNCGAGTKPAVPAWLLHLSSEEEWLRATPARSVGYCPSFAPSSKEGRFHGSRLESLSLRFSYFICAAAVNQSLWMDVSKTSICTPPKPGFQ